MDTLLSAAKALKHAEDQIKALVQDALSQSKFAEARALVDVIAELALSRDRLNVAGASKLGVNHPREEPKAVKAEGAKIVLGTPKSVTTPAAPVLIEDVRHTGNYPRFERDGDRLAKLGWSVKDKRVYEHRTDKDTVRHVCESLSNGVRSKRPFKMEKFLPVKLQGGAEVPSYQAYLILKWLQHYGLIEKRGKDGYVLIKIPISSEDIDELWNRTPERFKSETPTDKPDGPVTHG